MQPGVTDRKVLSEKVVFRGNANLHTLYRSEEGQLHGWDFDLPFSQYAELSGEYGPDAQVDFALCPTSMELETDDEGRLHLKCGMTAQYCITDREQIAVVEDAYSPNREMTVHTEMLEIPAILENRRETMYAQASIPESVNTVADISFLPDFPKQKYREGSVEAELPGSFQALYYGEDGALRAGNARWEDTLHLNADDHTAISVIPSPAVPQSAINSGQLSMKAELPLELISMANQQIPMVTGLVLGEEQKPDPGRPSLILRRAGDNSLWQIAKASHSTVRSIREANDLQNEPAPGQLLLIPVL